MKDRIIELDLMRALAIVLIVLCHLHNYINSRFLEKYSYFPISFLGLNIFFMLSGFLLNQSRNIKSKDEIIIYVKKRVRRIYPLYWLAFVSFIVLDLLNIGEYTGTIRNTKLTFLFLNILGLQGLFPMQCTIYGTWFVGVILLYYFMYIFIRSYSKGINEIIIKSVIIMIPFVILRIKFGLIRPEVFIYYLVFVSGIIASEVRDFNKFLSVSVYYIAMMILLLIAYFCRLLPLKTILVLAQYQIFSFIGVFVV
ncbi:MAG: acyltransferase family protein, partial [Methanobacterium sp.]